MKTQSTIRWKGKFISAKQFGHKVSQQKAGQKRKKSVDQIENDTYDTDNHDGRRIVELKVLGQQLWCIPCKEALSLQFIENEIRQGLSSQLSVRCHKCLIMNQVYTSKRREGQDKRSARYDTNYKIVLGTLHTGIGWMQLSKLFACLNIPCLGFKTYKKYESEIGIMAEKVAETSCADAVALEKKLTMEQVDSIKQLL